MKLSDEQILNLALLCEKYTNTSAGQAIRQLMEERDRYREALLSVLNDPYTNGFSRALAKQALGEGDE